MLVLYRTQQTGGKSLKSAGVWRMTPLRKGKGVTRREGEEEIERKSQGQGGKKI